MANLDEGENRFNFQPSTEKPSLPEKYAGFIGRMRFAVDYVGRVTKILLYAGITGKMSLPRGKEDNSLLSLVLDKRKPTL